MRHTKRTVRTLAVKADTFDRLKRFGRFGESWDEFFNRLLHDVENVRFELLQVDGGPPDSHTVVYVIGNAKYRFANGKYSLVGVP